MKVWPASFEKIHNKTFNHVDQQMTFTSVANSGYKNSDVSHSI